SSKAATATIVATSTPVLPRWLPLPFVPLPARTCRVRQFRSSDRPLAPMPQSGLSPAGPGTITCGSNVPELSVCAVPTNLPEMVSVTSSLGQYLMPEASMCWPIRGVVVLDMIVASGDGGYSVLPGQGGPATARGAADATAGLPSSARAPRASATNAETTRRIRITITFLAADLPGELISHLRA